MVSVVATRKHEHPHIHPPPLPNRWTQQSIGCFKERRKPSAYPLLPERDPISPEPAHASSRGEEEHASASYQSSPRNHGPPLVPRNQTDDTLVPTTTTLLPDHHRPSPQLTKSPRPKSPSTPTQPQTQANTSLESPIPIPNTNNNTPYHPGTNIPALPPPPFDPVTSCPSHLFARF